MNFLARMFRFIFWMVVVSWSVAILRRLVRNMGRGSFRSEPPMDVPSDAVTRKLVRDPECGMHLAEVVAIPVRQGGDLVHFCSAECRDKYLNKTHKLAANA